MAAFVPDYNEKSLTAQEYARLEAADKLEAKIKRIDAQWVMVDTNDGTYGAIEAQRLIGTGDPKFATWKRYRNVAGKERMENPEAEIAGVGRPQAPSGIDGQRMLISAASKLKAMRAEREELAARVEKLRAL